MKDVTDIRSNPKEQIVHVAEVIKKSSDRRKVFEAIYNTKQKIKTVSEVVDKTKLSRMRVLQEAGNLANNRIITKTKKDNRLAYEKDPFFTQHKKKILSIAGKKEKIAKIPTKSNPLTSMTTIKVTVPSQRIKVHSITIDDIDSFSKVKKVKSIQKNFPIQEKVFKKGIQKIIGEPGSFNDWGGEKNDLYTSRIKIKGKRKSTAFAFKGKGTSGILTPAKMGKNGDQIQRLFENPAEVFIIQYWDRIGEAVIEQANSHAKLKSLMENKEIFVCFIDGKDTQKLLDAYRTKF